MQHVLVLFSRELQIVRLGLLPVLEEHHFEDGTDTTGGAGIHVDALALNDQGSRQAQGMQSIVPAFCVVCRSGTEPIITVVPTAPASSANPLIVEIAGVKAHAFIQKLIIG